jgi:septal ring-binding cell division protein DamX
MRDYEEKSYYEIQLDNKQLILVFLAAVTVCVLIFVLGVMIGKGQKEAEFAAASRDEKKLAAAESDSNLPQQPLVDIAEEARTEEQSSQKEPVREKRKPETETTNEEVKKPAAVTAVKEKEEESSQQQKYAYEDLDKTETTKPVAEKPQTENTAVAEKPKQTEPVSTAAAATEDEEPKAEGNSRYTVQVMATSSKPKAEEQLSRLKSKGYTPFMDESRTGDISVFKVRVGRFADTQDAKEMAQKIKTDLKVETWVAPLD